MKALGTVLDNEKRKLEKNRGGNGVVCSVRYHFNYLFFFFQGKKYSAFITPLMVGVFSFFFLLVFVKLQSNHKSRLA